jgi:glutathione S-transferase
MKLYYAPGACSLAGHIVAAEGGLALELEKVDLKTHTIEGGADFRAINPKGYVPALVMDDGTLLTENGAILPFLGDKTGQSFAPLFHGGSAQDAAKAREKIRAQLKLVEQGMAGDYLMGDRFSPPDAYLFVILRWCEKLRIDMSDQPRLRAFKARMESRPGVVRALKEEGL